MQLGQDLRQGVRLLARNPSFTAIAVLILGLAIGVNSAMFTLVNALLLRPITGVSADRLVGIYSRDRATPDSYRAFSYDEYRELAGSDGPFERVLARNFAMVGLGEGETTRRVFAEIVSSNFFETLGAPVARGRSFSAAEQEPGSSARVAVIGHGLWKRMGSDPSILGSTLRVNAQDYTVVGIANEGFSGTMAIASPELWLPLGVYDEILNDFQQRGEHRTLADPLHRNLILAGVLKPGLGVEQARPALALLGARLAERNPDQRTQELLISELPRLGVSDQPQSNREPALAAGLLMAMASLVLLIACLNLANMLLARGESRRKEIAVRLALGAGRSRIVRQLLTEGLVLSGAGGVLGLVLAWWATRLLVSSLAPLVPLAIVFRPEPDLRVLLATFLFCALATVAFGLGPALRLSRTDVHPELKAQAGELRAKLAGLAPRNVLVVAQIALSLALLTTGGLFVRGALAAAAADPGFRLEGGLIVEVDPALAGDDEAAGRAAYRAVLDRVRAMPGVAGASLASTVPFGNISDGRRVSKPGAAAAEGARVPGEDAQYVVVGSGYFEALGLSMLRGRDFTAAEEMGGQERIAIVNEPLARKLWPGEEPVGRQIVFAPRSGEAAEAPLLVVGVAPGLRHELSDEDPVPHVYVPFGPNYQSGMNLHVRAARGEADLLSLLSSVRQQVREAAPRLPILSATTLLAHREDGISLWLVRTGARLFTLFGAVALLLAVVGVYGVKAYLVARRTREIGIRMALGANSRDVLRLVLGEGLAVTGTGLAIGLLLAIGSGQVASSLLYRVSPTDPVVFSLAAVLLAASALVAAWIPARRATRIAPSVALRSE
jgi:predicted permease